MIHSYDTLTKMLTQEKKLGYKNTIVFGGIEKFTPNWAGEALQLASDEAERQFIEEIRDALNAYAAVPPDDRPHYLHQILVKLHKAAESVQDEPDDTALVTGESQPQPHREPRQRYSASPPPPPEPPRPEPSPAPDEARPPARPSRPASDSAPAQSQPAGAWSGMGLDSPVSRLPGIKEAMAGKLGRLGVFTIGDFLRLYPRRYDDYRRLKAINQLEMGEEVTIIAQIWEARKQDTRHNKSIVKAILTDGTATIEVSWFNQPWLVNSLRPGMQIVVSGTVDAYLGRLTFISPEWEELDKEMTHTGRLVPVYPLTSGITAKWLRGRIKTTVDYWANRLPDYLPEDARRRLNMLPLAEAIRQIHFPDSLEDLEAARRRLAFDELLMIQLGVFRQRQEWQAQQGQAIHVDDETLANLLGALPFELTAAQQKALDEILADLRLAVPMSRLLQGDVGSGKTVVALAAMVLTALDDGQAAILAPTEILAEQHYQSMSKLLVDIGQALDREFKVQLLTGSTAAADRKEILAHLADGQTDILIGTHAIIQEDVSFNSLRLAIIDEQHRFGVEQRSALRNKGFNPHMLVMTATPIPRTLALTLYGDLDLSIIDEMPPGRQVIRTRWLTPNERERAYSFIQSQVEQGRQAYIICPLVEESDKTEAKSAVEEHKRLSTQVFPKLKLGLLHGRMKPKEKETVMKAFRDQKANILVSTSVVEVGIDIPNSTVMLVEGANRFGLAQLHQFRGRVGRGEHQSYCLLLADKESPEIEQRLRAVEQTGNGFELAEYDLKLRGPGEFFGTRQSGLPDLKLVKLTDTRLLELARTEAQQIFEKDRKLEQPEHRLLAKQVTDFWKSSTDLS
jgi:ATP-dependent DNA helicase RecG